MDLPKKKFLWLFVCLLLTGTILSGCGLRPKPSVKVDEIEIWGVWDDSDVMNDFIKMYKGKNKQVSQIKYRKIPFGEYESELIKAFAAGNGPDIFSIHNTWLAKHADLMLSMEAAVIAYNKAVDSASGCSKPSKITEPILTERQYNEAFVDVASKDFIKNKEIYGIPLTIDTLALFYNEDLFREAGIAKPPRTWEELKETARRLTKKDEYDNFIQSGVAMGTASNVYRAGDILALMIMQGGSSITDSEKLASLLDSRVQKKGSDEYTDPTSNALELYTSFANGSSPHYSWNIKRHQSVDAFQEGQVAMMFNYTYAVENLKVKAPKINFKIAEVPQMDGALAQEKIAYANYWGYAVSKKSLEKPSRALEAWRFLKFIGEKEQVASYAEKTNQPASRRDIIADQIGEPVTGVFAQQALSAQSWYQPDEAKMSQIFESVIDKVALGSIELRDASEEIKSKIEVIMKEHKDRLKDQKADQNN